MNDRLRIASEQLAALNAQQHVTSDRGVRVAYALADADALIAAAGENESADDIHAALERTTSKLAACEREMDALRRRMEPLTEDEANRGAVTLANRDGINRINGDDLVVLSLTIDRIRAERGE